MATKSEVINLIKQKIVDSEVYVENLKGDDHLQVTVISSEFNEILHEKMTAAENEALKIVGR